MSLGRFGAIRRPLLRALLFSAVAHLLVLMAGERELASVVEASGVAGKKLQALSVSVSGANTPSLVRQPMPQRHHPESLPVFPHTSVLAIADAAPPRPPTAASESARSGSSSPLSPVADVAATPPSAGVPVAANKVDASGREPALPAGYMDAVRGYRIALASHAKRFRLYPPAAREMGIGGRSEIEIVVPVLNSPQLRLRESSGHEELDQAALEMIRRAVEHVELPALLKERPLLISLPVEFLPPP